ncbi:MAG: GNAT family N-acetyltransferase [Bacteroidetes bacterium]|nr:GNAT family N-acetyltransferase [Bacteroidota bacterium]
MRVQLYDPSWKERVIRLTLHEYPFMESWFNRRFEALYEHPLQEGRCRILLATEGEALAGMVSYVYWPLEGTGKNCRSYQILGVLVSPDFRGKGVFATLLDAMKQAGTDDKADYLIGFPVPASKPAFVKKGWTHVFDLSWYIRPLSILAALRRRAFKGGAFSSEVPENLESDGFMQTAADSNFWKYRRGLMPEWPSWWHEFQKDGYRVCIQFRIGVRKGLNEAIIGKIYPGSAPATIIRAALRSLFGALRKEGSTVFVSLALNPSCKTETLRAVEKMFLKTGKQIHFINMSFSGNTDGFSPEDWNMMRGDIDTW